MKRLWFRTGGIISIAVIAVVGAILSLQRVQYFPSVALQQAEKFVALMANNKIEEAYALTDKKAGVGNTPVLFQQKVKKEWLDHGGCANPALHLRNVFPFQSLGHHLKRIVFGKNTRMEQISFDFYAQNIPFEVRMKYQGGQKWAVIYFQSHAL